MVFVKNGKNYSLPYSNQLILRMNKLVQDIPYQDRVLLFAGSDDILKKIMAKKLFSLVISSNKRDLSQKWDKSEKEDPSLLMRQGSSKTLSMVPLGGVGVLRGGILRQQRSPSLSEILGKGQKKKGQFFYHRLTYFIIVKCTIWIHKSS